MLEIVYGSQFKRDYKKYKNNENVRKRLRLAVELLCKHEQLPLEFRDHQLKGDLRAFRECHVMPDVLLIYRIREEALYL